MKSWDELKFWELSNYDNLMEKLHDKPQSQCNYLPRKDDWYKAFELTPPDKVKVVILGQDPYPTKGHAHGLAFSVQPHVRPIPGSLRNIFAEYSSDLGYPTPRSGDLTPWAERGVLLLNTILTVEEGKPLSHAGLGWEKLTYEVIKRLSDMSRGIVFILWGSKAQEYSALIPQRDYSNFVLCSAHPSPLAARKGFFGSRPFTTTNRCLTLMDYEPVDWKLP